MGFLTSSKKQPTTKQALSANHLVGQLSIHDQAAHLASDPDIQAENESKCPFAHGRSSPSSSPLSPDSTPVDKIFDHSKANCKRYPYRFVPLSMTGSTHTANQATKQLIDEVGGVDALLSMTGGFYRKAFQDPHIDQFIASHQDPHAVRFANWVAEKFGAGKAWSQEKATRSREPRPVGGGHAIAVVDRSTAHAAAWYSAKRNPRDIGQHFKLDDSRTWMRLHFWALKEAGLHIISPSFADYYVRFISRFVTVYEREAPAFAREAWRWSDNPKNLEEYLSNGRRMPDVQGVSVGKALKQLPEEEAHDTMWPYYSKMPAGYNPSYHY